MSKIWLIAALFVSLCGTSQAAVYRWVDENGVTQFGNRPPPTQQAERMRLRYNRSIGGPETQAQEGEETAKASQADQAACQRAQRDLALLRSEREVSFKNAKGELTQLNDSQRSAEQARLQGFVENFCQ